MADITASYGSYDFPNIVGKFSFRIDYRNFYFTCRFVILAASESNLVALCNSAEEECRKFHQRLKLRLGGTDEYDLDPDQNTGFQAEPSLSIVKNPVHTGRSRMYQFTLQGKLPADLDGDNYTRDTAIILSQPELNRETLSIRGITTAAQDVGGTPRSATYNYENFAAPWADTVATDVFGTSDYELLSQNKDYQKENKVLIWTRLYHHKLNMTVTYNGYTIPNNYNKYSFQENYFDLSMSVEFKVPNSSVSAAEIALRQPNKDLSINIGGGSIVYNYSHGSNTGFLGRPQLRKTSDKSDDLDYVHYVFSISMGLPADETGKGYRQSGNYTVSYEPTRARKISFTGKYTAGGANGAQENYDAGAKTWALSLLSSLGVTNYELVSENTTVEQENKELTFTLIYDELTSKDTADLYNDIRIVNAECNYTVDIEEAIGKSITSEITALPPVRVNYNYKCQVNFEEVTEDLNLGNLYINVIRPWLINQLRNITKLDNFVQAGITNFIAESEGYSIDPNNYRVSGNLVCLAPASQDQIIMFSEQLQTDYFSGLVVNKIYSGRPYEVSVWDSGAEQTVRRTVTVTRLGSPQSRPPALEPTDRYFLLSRSVVDQANFNGQGFPYGGVIVSEAYSTTFVEFYRYGVASLGVQTP